jgi:hypothetical protein
MKSQPLKYFPVVVESLGGPKGEIGRYRRTISFVPDRLQRRGIKSLVDRKEKGSPCNTKGEGEPVSNPGSLRPNTTRPSEEEMFDHFLMRIRGSKLVRSASSEQTPQALPIAAARQLCWDLRAKRGEFFVRTLDGCTFQKIYEDPDGGSHGPPPLEVVRLIRERTFPHTLQELEAHSVRPLYQYLKSRNLNLLIPLVKKSRLLGWLAFALDPIRCTDDLLDGLQVAGYLLATSISDTYPLEAEDANARVCDMP